MSLSMADLKKMPQTTIQLSSHGTETSYEGISLYDILKKAGAPLGDAMKGKALSACVLAEARDGYAVVYALAELEPALTAKRIVVADSIGGKPLPPSQGPFRLVVSGEKKPARSIRMVEKISVVQLRK
jgi:hypothetical protein